MVAGSTIKHNFQDAYYTGVGNGYVDFFYQTPVNKTLTVTGGKYTAKYTLDAQPTYTSTDITNVQGVNKTFADLCYKSTHKKEFETNKCLEFSWVFDNVLYVHTIPAAAEESSNAGIIVLIIALVLAAGGAGGFYYYKKQQKNKNKSHNEPLMHWVDPTFFIKWLTTPYG